MGAPPPSFPLWLDPWILDYAIAIRFANIHHCAVCAWYLITKGPVLIKTFPLAKLTNQVDFSSQATEVGDFVREQNAFRWIHTLAVWMRSNICRGYLREPVTVPTWMFSTFCAMWIELNPFTADFIQQFWLFGCTDIKLCLILYGLVYFTGFFNERLIFYDFFCATRVVWMYIYAYGGEWVKWCRFTCYLLVPLWLSLY